MSIVGLPHLRSFAAVAEAGSITGAGRALYLGQPAVTRQIAALERATRMQLLQRTHRGVELTEDGGRFLRGARRVLAAYDGLLGTNSVPVRPPREGLMDSLEDDERPAPVIGQVMRLGIEADAPREATESVRAFARGRPGGLWRITRAHESDLRAMLEDGHIDAAVVWLPPGDEALGGVVVGQVQLLAAMPSVTAERYPGPVPWSVWTELPLAMWDRSDGPAEYDYWTELITRRSGPITTTSVPQLDNAQEQMLDAVATGTAVCFVTESHWHSHLRPGVEVRPLDPPLQASLHLLWASARPSAWVADLVSAF